MAVKGGEDAGLWSIAWRSDHKIHVLTDVLGRPATIRLTPGNVSDIRIADELIEAARPARRLIADHGYDANRLRRAFQDDVHANALSATMNGAIVIAGESKQRSVASRTSGGLPHDMLAINFLSAVVPAAIIAFWV
jgi:transposase